MLIGAPEGYLFDANAPHTYCRVCGAVFQTQRDRDSVLNAELRIQATVSRKRWSFRHAETHSAAEQSALTASGRYCTVEAMTKLVPLGIIPLTDMVMSPDHEEAANKAPRLDADVQDRMEEQKHGVL